MPFAVICLDRPDTAAMRAATRLAHLEYINPHRAKMRIGGALLDDECDERVGMVFAIDLPTREAVEAFMREEPYNRAGIFEMVLIRRINIVYPETDPSVFDNLLADERKMAGA
jgi:uncharacterized protein